MRWVLMPAAVALTGAVGALDLHRLWDDRCLECHGHAGEFARQHLQVVDGALIGRHHADLRPFLRNHYLPEEAVEPVVAMLLAQAGTTAQFAQRCRSCHDNAATFARASVRFQDGELLGVATGQPVASFLRRHQSLTADEAVFFTGLLERVRREVAED